MAEVVVGCMNGCWRLSGDLEVTAILGNWRRGSGLEPN